MHSSILYHPPRIHHQRRLAGDLSPVVRRMVGRDHHAVGLGQGSVQIAHAGHLHALVVETGHMGIVVGDIRPLLLQQVDDVQGRRFADVAHVPFVGHAQHQHLAALNRLGGLVEFILHPLHPVMGHVGVDLAGQLDEAGLVGQRAQLPGEIVGVHRDAVAAQPRAGRELHEAEGLGGRGVDDLPSVQPQFVAHEQQLVSQADVHRTEGVLEKLDHLGRVGRGDGDQGLDGCAVAGHGHLQAGGGHAADDLGRVVGGPVRAPRVHPLRREGQEELFAHFQLLTISAQPGQQHLGGGARIGGRFQHHQHARVQMASNLLGGGHDVGDVRLACFVQGRGHADGDRVALLQGRKVAGGPQAGAGRSGMGVGRGLEGDVSSRRRLLHGRLHRFLHQCGQGLRGHVLDIGLAPVDGVHLALIQIDAHDFIAGLGEVDGQGQAHIAETDDGHPGVAVLEF